MQVIDKSYELPSEVRVRCPAEAKVQGVRYFSDCVFQPHVYDIAWTPEPSEGNFQELRLQFNFLLEQICKHPSIVHSIGVLNFNTASDSVFRLGTLVTQENGKLFISFIE